MTAKPTFRGNKGNLLQHWVLCELTLLLKAQISPSTRLALIDAHAMSPYAVYKNAPSDQFERVRRSLPRREGAYERAWSELVGKKDQLEVTYPTTAMFVRHLWPGPVSMLLCDHDKPTIDHITIWKETVADAETIFPSHGDWRDKLRGKLPRGGATIVSFDPFMIIHENTATLDPGNMNLPDLIQAAAALCHISRGPSIVQVSTYSARNSSQAELLPVAEWIMRAVGFELLEHVRAGGDMMSMVFARGIPNTPLHLDERFDRWLNQIG